MSGDSIMKKLSNKQLGAVVAAAGIAVGSLGTVAIVPLEKEVQNPINAQLAQELLEAQAAIAELEAQEPETVTKIEYVNQTVAVEVPVEVEVLPESAKDFVAFLEDEEGDLRELDIDAIEDAEDPYAEMINQVAFILESKQLAARTVDNELADELDKYEFNATVTFDEDDIEDIDVDDDLDELKTSGIDFDDEEITIEVRAEFEHDDVEYEAILEVEIKEGKVDDFDIKEVNQL